MVLTNLRPSVPPSKLHLRNSHLHKRERWPEGEDRKVEYTVHHFEAQRRLPASNPQGVNIIELVFQIKR
ncbi:hypothetical protein HKD37_08G020867 [Glycine soja]|nr:hypothetical protein GmHk_08G021182 [Glycine max]